MANRILKPDSSNNLILQDGDSVSRVTLNAGGTSVLSDEGGTSAISIQADGDIDIAENIYLASGKGIYFDGQTTATHFLDDYEEGTWTATSANGGVASYGNQTGYYTRIGRLVQVQFFSDAWVLNSAVNPYITGFPFSASSDAYAYSGGYSFHDTWNPGSSTGFIPLGGTTIRFTTRDSTGYTVTASSGSEYIMFTAIYMTD